MRKDRFASLVTYAARAAEQGAGYVSGEKRVNWEAVTRVSARTWYQTLGLALTLFVRLAAGSGQDQNDDRIGVARVGHDLRAARTGRSLQRG